jgi:hypothetical protein
MISTWGNEPKWGRGGDGDLQITFLGERLREYEHESTDGFSNIRLLTKLHVGAS